MMLTVPDLLGASEVADIAAALMQADWVDGRGTAGHVAVKAKDNRQLAPGHPLAERIGKRILEALSRHPAVMSAALPFKVLPPRFNRYEGGGQYGDHVDSAVLSVPGSSHRVRSDISATLFFSNPQEYEGGELVVRDHYSEQRVKLAAGSLVLYPGTSLHRVTPVSTGVRLASFFWIQSLVRDDTQRSVLYDLDQSIQRLRAAGAADAEIARLTGVYHNLLRFWSET